MQRSSIPFIIIPVALPAAYLLYLSWAVTSRTTVTIGQAGSRDSSSQAASRASTPSRPISLPADVDENSDSQWVVTYERVVSLPVSVSNITVSDASDTAVRQDEKEELPLASMLQAYTRATHLAFRRTLQAKLMRAAIRDLETKHTFDVGWTRNLSFQVGDIVNGAYKVVYHGPGSDPASERIELMIEAPASYRGPPPPKGLILAQVQHVSGQDKTEEPAVMFVNETWMWRRQDEKPTLIESGLQASVHRLMARWLVVNGVMGASVGM